MEEQKNIQHINSYIETEDYKRLRMKLLQQGKSFTQWLREKVKQELATS